MERQFNVCDKVRVARYNREADSNFTDDGKDTRARIMPSLVGKIVLVVDYSDSHGLTYGVVEPNFNGSRNRKDELEIHWLEPEELEQITGVIS